MQRRTCRCGPCSAAHGAVPLVMASATRWLASADTLTSAVAALNALLHCTTTDFAETCDANIARAMDNAGDAFVGHAAGGAGRERRTGVQGVVHREPAGEHGAVACGPAAPRRCRRRPHQAAQRQRARRLGRPGGRWPGSQSPAPTRHGWQRSRMRHWPWRCRTSAKPPSCPARCTCSRPSAWTRRRRSQARTAWRTRTRTGW